MAKEKKQTHGKSQLPFFSFFPSILTIDLAREAHSHHNRRNSYSNE